MEQQTQSSSGPVIILAVDNSKHSDYALQYYITQVHKPGNVLHVVHCSEGWTSAPMDGGPSPGHVQELKQKDEQMSRDLHQKFTKAMTDAGITGEFHMLKSSSKHVWHDIVSYQEKVGAIMIVIGSRGLGAIRRTMMGSVSDSVVHHANCPVLVCRHS